LGKSKLKERKGKVDIRLHENLEILSYSPAYNLTAAIVDRRRISAAEFPHEEN